jgi:hypothetical protein
MQRSEGQTKHLQEASGTEEPRILPEGSFSGRKKQSTSENDGNGRVFNMTLVTWPTRMLDDGGSPQVHFRAISALLPVDCIVFYTDVISTISKIKFLVVLAWAKRDATSRNA